MRSINFDILARWIISYAIGCMMAAAFLVLFSPIAIVSMVGSGFLGFWILYNLSVVPLAFGASVFQAVTLRSLRPNFLAWVLSATVGWMSGAILALNLPDLLNLDVLSVPMLLSLWVGGGLFAGILQWATVLRSPKGLFWILANSVSIFLIPVVVATLSTLTTYASAIFPPNPEPFSTIWIIALAFSLLALLGIIFVSVVSYGAAMGLVFTSISPESSNLAA
jgi:hypothetical protein